MTSPAFSSLHRCRVRYVVAESGLAQVTAALAVHPAGFVEDDREVRVHDVYFGRTSDDDGVESGRDGLATSLRFRWHGDDPTSALGLLQLEAESAGLSCQVSQRIDACIDLTRTGPIELRALLLDHVQGFVRLELARRGTAGLQASVLRRSLRSRDGRLLVTIDRQLSACRAEVSCPVGLQSTTVDPECVVVVLQAHQSHVAALHDAAAELPFPRSDAGTASKARFRLPK